MFPLRLCGGKLLVAVTRERRYGPSRLRVDDDDRGDNPAFTPARVDTRLYDPSWVDLVGWLHTEMVYAPEDGHLSKY